MAKPGVIAGALLIVLGGAAIGFAVTREATGGISAAGTAAMGAATAGLDGDIKAARGQVEQRAKTLSETGELRGSIGTDANTTMERIGKEIGFKPEANEVLELVQRPKAGGPVTTLMLLPDDKMKSAHDGTPGAYVDLMGDQLLVTQVVEVVASDAEAVKTLDGFVVASRKLSLKPAVDQLVAAGITGRLEIGQAKLAIGTMPPDGTTKSMPLPSEPSASLVVYVPPVRGGMPVPIVGGGAAAAGLGLILLLIGMMAGKAAKSAGSSGLLAQNQLTAAALGATQLSTPSPAFSAATPSPYASSDPSGSMANLGDGQQIGRWQIIKRLGSGGMADVFLAHARGEAGFEKQVALKVMHSHLARNERAVAHFLDEARLASRVRHPNVVAIQDLGKIGDDYVIVMDYIDGVDLERLLAKGREDNRPVPIEIGLAIMCRICDGLNAAHTATAADGTALNLIHRDVKSANVLISKQGAVQVVDFGIAKAATQSHLTQAGETKGTPSMMAPEQRVGEQVDVRADVYSVAAVGFEVLTGAGVNLDLAALAHLGVENWPHLPLPSSIRAGLPLELDEILLRAMSFEREKRPANCAVFGEAFEHIMKKYNLNASDKDIARWIDSELAGPQRMARSS